MINLLPPQENLKIKKDYNLRLTVVYSALFAIVFVIGIVLLLPSYFLADIRLSEANNEIESILNSAESNEREAVNDELLLTKERLTALTKEDTRPNLYSVIREIALIKGGAVSLSRFSYVRGEEGELSRLQFRGFSATRIDLLAFTRALEANELFDSVDLPVQSLAKDQDIEFSIEIQGTF